LREQRGNGNCSACPRQFRSGRAAPRESASSRRWCGPGHDGRSVRSRRGRRSRCAWCAPRVQEAFDESDLPSPVSLVGEKRQELEAQEAKEATQAWVRALKLEMPASARDAYPLMDPACRGAAGR
jgi:hypothetical protein